MEEQVIDHDLQSFSMRLPRKLHRALRILAIEKRTSLTALLQKGAEQVLEQEGGGA
jgi:predicted HicB family RNase H-like nuclease